MLKRSYTKSLLEGGCDEAGRGCLAGPVFAAAVVLGKGFPIKDLDDSKKLSERKRDQLRILIERKATSWFVASVSHGEIDEINILNASFLAMHRSVDKLDLKPELLLIDGNRFNPYKFIPHQCIVKGDAKFASIAAASILAKTHRDEFMLKMHKKFPVYGWDRNKGYPTKMHRDAIVEYGSCKIHRKSFRLLPA